MDAVKKGSKYKKHGLSQGTGSKTSLPPTDCHSKSMNDSREILEQFRCCSATMASNTIRTSEPQEKEGESTERKSQKWLKVMF